jgi:hypothetical protein
LCASVFRPPSRGDRRRSRNKRAVRVRAAARRATPSSCCVTRAATSYSHSCSLDHLLSHGPPRPPGRERRVVAAVPSRRPSPPGTPPDEPLRPAGRRVRCGFFATGFARRSAAATPAEPTPRGEVSHPSRIRQARVNNFCGERERRRSVGRASTDDRTDVTRDAIDRWVVGDARSVLLATGSAPLAPRRTVRRRAPWHGAPPPCVVRCATRGELQPQRSPRAGPS